MQPCNDTIYKFFCDFAEERPNDRFIFDEDVSFTVREAFHTILSLASQMQEAGIGKSMPVAVVATRTVNTILSFFALQFIGAKAILFDPRESGDGYGFVLRGDTVLHQKGKTVLDFAPRDVRPELSQGSKDRTIVIFTSGSTGEPKEVYLSQYNFINNSLDTRDIGGYFPDDINIDIVPIHHVFGLALIFTAVVTRHCIFVPRSVDADYIVQSIIRHHVTRLNGVPSLYLAMAESPLAGQIRSLRYGLIGGAPCTKEQFERIEHGIGITLIPVYGMSECIGISCGSWADDADARRTSVGKIYSMNTVRIAADGEILVKSPAMAYGVAKDDGFLHTGDIGCLNEKGFLCISGRKKDVIIRHGNNLSVLAIEQKLLRQPCVRDVCVVGIKDEKEGEVPAAAIVLKEGCLPNEQSLFSDLIKPEIPKYIKAVAAIPLTSSGKPDKQRVRAMFQGD